MEIGRPVYQHLRQVSGLQRSGPVVFVGYNYRSEPSFYDVVVTMEGDEDVHEYRFRVQAEDVASGEWVLT